MKTMTDDQLAYLACKHVRITRDEPGEHEIQRMKRLIEFLRPRLVRSLAWQPIASAPKDGTTVIIGRDAGEFGFVRGYGRFEGREGDLVSGWISIGFTDPPGNLGLAHPTHWQPLPAAPEASHD